MRIGKNIDINIKFVKEDLWLGLYYKKDKKYISWSNLSGGPKFGNEYTFFICLIPCLPFIIKKGLK